MTISSMSKAPVACSPYNDRFIIRLTCYKGTNGIPSNSFNQTRVTPKNSSTDAITHIPNMNSVIQTPTSQRRVIWRPIKIYLLQAGKKSKSLVREYGGTMASTDVMFQIRHD